MARNHYDDDDFDELEDDDFDDDDFEEETPRQRKKRERAEAKARKKKQARARKRKKHAEMSDYEDDDGYEDDLDDQAEEMADDSLDEDDTQPEDDYDDDDEQQSSGGGSFKDLITGKGNTKLLVLRYIVPPVVGIVVGLIGGAMLFGGSSNNNQQVAQTSQKGVKPIESIQHAYSLTDVINSISHAQVNTLQRQLSQLSANGDDNGYSDDQFEQAKQAVSGINGMTNDVINPFLDKVLTMPVTESHKDQKSTALDDAVNNASSSSSSSSSQSGKSQQSSSQAKGSSQSSSSQKASSSSSSNNTQPSKANSSSDDDGTNPVSRSVAQDKAAQIFSQENDKISKDKNERTQIAGEILASGPANDLQQAGLKSGNAMAFEAGADKKTFTYVVAVPYSTKTKTVNAIFTMKIGADKRIKSYHYVGYLNQINDQAKNFYNDLK